MIKSERNKIVTEKKAKTFLNILAYFLLFLAGDLCSSILFDLIFSFVQIQNTSLHIIFRMLGCTLLTLLFFWFYTDKALHLKMTDFKVTWDIKPWGVMVSVLLPALVAAVYLFIGEIEVHMFAPGEMFIVILASIMIALKSGILEEILFRGFIMTLLEKRWNKYVAVFVPSFLFGILHIPSMEYFTVGGILLLVISGTLVGVMFSLAAYKGNSISNGALMHAAWNFVMITDVLHITTAEGAYGEPVISVLIPSEHIWLTGAGFGVEASLTAVVGYALVCVFLVLTKKKTPEACSHRL